MTDFGVYYTCYTEKESIEYSLGKLFEIYPNVPVYLVSDGGMDYSYLKKIYPNMCVNLEGDTRGKIPFITQEIFQDKQWQDYIKKSILVFMDRLKRAIEFCNKEYILIMEPDVLVRGKLNIPENSKLLGSRVNNGLLPELKKILRETEGAIEIDTWGATPAIIKSDLFIKAYNIIVNDDDLFDKLCMSEHRLANYDILLCVLFALMGIEEEFNPDITECYRNSLWQYTTHPLLHQYRAKYTTDNNGTHKNEIDKWLWEK